MSQFSSLPQCILIFLLSVFTGNGQNEQRETTEEISEDGNTTVSESDLNVWQIAFFTAASIGVCTCCLLMILYVIWRRRTRYSYSLEKKRALEIRKQRERMRSLSSITLAVTDPVAPFGSPTSAESAAPYDLSPIGPVSPHQPSINGFADRDDVIDVDENQNGIRNSTDSKPESASDHNTPVPRRPKSISMPASFGAFDGGRLID